MSDLFQAIGQLIVLLFSPGGIIFLGIAAYIVAGYWSISTIAEVNKKHTLTDDDVKTKNIAIGVLCTLIAIPFLFGIYYKFFRTAPPSTEQKV